MVGLESAARVQVGSQSLLLALLGKPRKPVLATGGVCGCAWPIVSAGHVCDGG